MSKENQADQEKLVEVTDPVVEKEETFDTEGLTAEEVKMAKEHGLVKEEKEEDKDGEHKEQSESKTTEDSGTEDKTEKTEEEVNADPDNFEDIDKVFSENEDKFHKTYTPNQKALYFKSKNEKKKRQDIQKELEEIKAESQLGGVQGKAALNKLNSIAEALQGEPTIEQLQAIIGGQQKAEVDDSKPVTQADLKRIKEDEKKDLERKNTEGAKIQEKITLAEQLGKSKYSNFDKITDLAKEIVDSDKSGTYRDILGRTLLDKDSTEEEFIERVLTIAKISPKFGELNKSAKPEEKEEVSKAIANSKKKVSSASLGSAGGKRSVAEDDLTVDDTIGMSTSKWMKLSDKTRQRLLGKPIS